MVLKKNLVYFFIAAAMSISSLAGCGGDQTYISPSTPIVYQGTVYYPSGYQNQAANTTNQCCCNTTTAGASPSPDSTPAPSPGKTPDPAKTTAPVVLETDQQKGRKILDKVLSTITTPNAFEAEVDKWEKGLKAGNIVQQTFKVDDKKPGKVKIDVLYHTTSSSIGTKLFFNVGSGKVTVRPGGVLSFITKEMAQTDTNLVTPNGFTPEQLDFFNISKHLSDPSYNAVLMGKTTINGNEVYVLKITKNGTNDLSPDIKYETMGFDPKTFQVKSWELYGGSNADSFLKITVKSFQPLTDIPDSTFKV